MSLAHKGHNRAKASSTDNWITPKWIIGRLGPFDLDPCACNPQPWPCATRSLHENGLITPWKGFVWLNPPYGRQLGTWLNRLALHNHGIALVFARTETQAFQKNVFPYATLLLFMRGRLTFCMPDGNPHPAGFTSGGPSVLIAYGKEAARRLIKSEDLGAIVRTSLNRFKSGHRPPGNISSVPDHLSDTADASDCRPSMSPGSAASR